MYADNLLLISSICSDLYISLFVCKHSTNTYIHKLLRLLIREGKKSNTREKKKKKKKQKKLKQLYLLFN